MNKSGTLIAELYSIRNRYGKKFSTQKLKWLHAISNEKLKTKKELQSWYDILLFLLAYPIIGLFTSLPPGLSTTATIYSIT